MQNGFSRDDSNYDQKEPVVLGPERCLDFLAKVADPRSNVWTMFYDGAGRMVTQSDSRGNTTKISYNGLGQVTQAVDPLGGTTSFSYDGDGNLLSLTDAKNHTTSFTYDNMDRVLTRTDPLNRSESYQYDLSGNLTRFTDRRGQVTTYSYDALGRRTLASFNVVSGVPESTVTFNYETNGDRLSSAVDSIAGTIGHSYNDVNRTVTETTPLGTVTYTFDALGRRSSMSVSGQSTTNYTYDNASRLTQITQGSQTVGFTYDNDNRRATMTFPNGIVATYSFDANSNLVSISYATGSKVVGNLDYTYDVLNRRTQIGGSLAQSNFPALVSSATYDFANELTNWNGTALSYDANGNMISDGNNTFTWNGRNQLASMNGLSLLYDGFGRRIQNLAGREFLYDGANPTQELISGTVTSNMITGGTDEVFTRTDSSGTYAPIVNALGSTVALADWGGTINTQYIYDPWGATTANGSSNNNVYDYTGRENESNGLYYYRARYYYPTLGRFISEDPIRFHSGSTNETDKFDRKDALAGRD